MTHLGEEFFLVQARADFMAEQVLAEWSQVAVCTYKSAGGTKTWLQTKRGEDGVAHLG